MALKKTTKAATNKAFRVLNKSDSIVTIPITDKFGKERTLIVPATWVYVDLMTQVDDRRDLDARNVRRAMEKGLIEEIDDEAAAELKKMPGFEEERRAVVSRVSNVSGVEGVVGGHSVIEVLANDRSAASESGADEVERTVEDEVAILLQSADGQVISRLRNMNDKRPKKFANLRREVLKQAKANKRTQVYNFVKEMD